MIKNMNTLDIQNKFNQQRFIIQKVIDKLTKKNNEIIDLKKKIKVNEEKLDSILFILANYDDRLDICENN